MNFIISPADEIQFNTKLINSDLLCTLFDFSIYCLSILRLAFSIFSLISAISHFLDSIKIVSRIILKVFLLTVTKFLLNDESVNPFTFATYSSKYCRKRGSLMINVNLFLLSSTDSDFTTSINFFFAIFSSY